MRMWHYKLLPYLPELQFKGQLRELVAIMRDWRDKGTTNHLLINKVMDYGKCELMRYFVCYESCYHFRYGHWLDRYSDEFVRFCGKMDDDRHYSDGWHDDEYLRICMANLYEKHKYGRGKSRISDAEWEFLLKGYKKITGEEYEV